MLMSDCRGFDAVELLTAFSLREFQSKFFTAETLRYADI